MAKKSHSQHPQKKQVSPMPLPYAHIVSGAPSFPHQPQMLDEDEDDLDDICPVCESECTCPKKSAPTLASTATEPSASSTLSSAPSSSQQPPAHAGKHPLKIKLTLSKARKPPATHAHPSSARFGSGANAAPSSSRPSNKSTAAGPSAPKRRGRPPKALAAKHGTKRKVDADDMEYRARGTTGTARKVYQPSVPVASTSAADLSDSALSDYPTFVPAATDSTHSSSSESSDSEITSDSDDESTYHVPNDESRLAIKQVSSAGQRRRDRGSNNKWEIRPRKKSVGAGEEDDIESSADSDDSADTSEDGDDENDGEEEEEADADVEAEADVEGTGLVEADVDLDDEEEERRSCIGITFPGNGWSDEDEEEESFDADLFFANLDGSSDSGASSPEEHYADLRSFTSDVEFSGSFSADEEDALLLMDLDPSVQLRRANGEFEIDVELDNFSFGWDGQLLLANSRMPDGLGLAFGMSGPDEDTDMYSASDSDEMGSDEGSGAGTIMQQDSDGDTTEDELVDSDGLPNSRAMMLFRWPSSVSAINPLSTVNPLASPPPDASPSTRIALASISTQRRSSPPTPADILAGKISMEELEDIEMDKEKYSPVCSRRGGPIMGEFAVENVGAPIQVAVVGDGREVPSFYPRPVRAAPRVELVQEAPVEDAFMSSLQPPISTESSDDAAQGLSQQSYASDPSETEAIELDDVLDSSLLDSEPSTQGCDTDIPDPQSQSSPIKGSHISSLSRWDRIPMATFRRTRETATASGVDGAASDTGLGALQYRGFGGGALPLFSPPLDKMSRASARKRKSRPGHSHGASPTLSARDGMLGSPFAPAPGFEHAGKTKKELKKEKAMVKRKLVAKSSQYRYQQPHRSHHQHSHLPNHKSRATSSVQRSSGFPGAGSSIPSLTI